MRNYGTVGIHHNFIQVNSGSWVRLRSFLSLTSLINVNGANVNNVKHANVVNIININSLK